MTDLNNAYSIIPPSGEYGKDWPVHINIPQGASGGISTGGWTADNARARNFGNEGFIQQTFLGASITDFDLSAGFGDSPSSMTINLVNDEFNKSDGTGAGYGDDPYHSGIKDNFAPPVVGTPVFFKFGKNPATTEQAFRQTYDDLYKVKTLPNKSPNANNAWGHEFSESNWDKNNFNELESYHLVDIVARRVQDRSPLWDIDTYWRGRAHFNFGGILQSYTQNKGFNGKPVYSVQLTDPREILSNVEVLFNNYQGTTFNNKNLINLYGFLEYDPSPELLSFFNSRKQGIGIVDKFVNPINGNVDYVGVSAAWSVTTGWEKIIPKTRADVTVPPRTWSNPNSTVDFGQRIVNLQDQYYFGNTLGAISDPSSSLPEFFPITGQGFSRRNDKGMPFYRISQGLAALFQYYGFLPQEYVDAGFGGAINFRGYNYVVDFTGIPTEKIPLLYFMDFDKIDLLSFAQELCDIISHSLYVTLLPIIDHPACEFLYNYNNYQVNIGQPENIIAGIIRLDAIDKTKQPKYGAIKSYLDELEGRGINVESQDVGYELSNVVTDKFVVGAQEVETYFFSNERDRDELWTYNRENNSANMLWLQQYQWDLRTQEQQQILPYYGLIGNKAVSIPRGFGSYQQILLDTTSLNAYGVGNYYIATELELRAALVSYEKWKEFLLSYNDIYIEDISEHRAFLGALSSSDAFNAVREKFANLPAGNAKEIVNKTLEFLENKQYAVTVPRCVWNSDRPDVNIDGYPASPCSPPFGYPLYYRRATSIGIVEAGVGSIVNAKTRLVKDTANLQKTFENVNSPLLKLPKSTVFQKLKKLRQEINELARSNDPNVKNGQRYKSLIQQLNVQTQVFDHWEELNRSLNASNNATAFVENISNGGPLGKFLFNIEKTAKRHEENAKKVYDFIKSIADECLGKKFLVRIPKACNLGYSQIITNFNTNFNIKNGPFGFPPKPISSDPKAIGGVYYDANTIGGFNTVIANSLSVLNSRLNNNPQNLWHHYLQDYVADTNFTSRRPITDIYSFGALKGNYNPFVENWEWNYKPEPQGGFFGFNIFGVNMSALQALRMGVPWSSMPPAIQQGLCPLDMTNLLSDSNRVQCYVRYNHSETLDFTAVSPNDMVQQVISLGGQFIPDIVEELPNNNLDNKARFEAVSQVLAGQANGETQPPSMAFVKCSVDEKLYMPPKLKESSLKVFAETYEFTLSTPEPKIATGKGADCNKTTEIYPEILPLFSIPRNGGFVGTQVNWVDFERIYDADLDGWIINTNLEDLDDEHVYALITVPGRVRSLIDTRWNDGQNQMYQAAQLKHLMTQDTVQIPEFSNPTFPRPGRTVTIPCGPPPLFIPSDYLNLASDFTEAVSMAYGDALSAAYQYGLKNASVITGAFGLAENQSAFIPGEKEDWLKLSLEDVTSARKIAKQVIKGSIANNPNVRLNYTQPSPVYPDIVALPLMSMERCYGPWMSASQLDPSADARIKYSNIGGKVEFVKDENLAPWNYAGYQLMNEAGSLQANFSNSLLLFSERGGFSFPDAPTGIALAKALKAEGPLITSIGVNVSQGGVKTTVKLDLYTAQWGKLAQQKEMAISQIARERQKLRDVQNNAIRRGLGKRATSSDLVNTVMNAGGKQVLNMINGITSQIETNRSLGAKISEAVIAVGSNGGVTYNDAQDLQKYTDTGDTKLIQKELETHVIAPAADMWRAISNDPTSSTLASLAYNTFNSLNWITNTNNHIPQD